MISYLYNIVGNSLLIDSKTFFLMKKRCCNSYIRLPLDNGIQVFSESKKYQTKNRCMEVLFSLTHAGLIEAKCGIIINAVVASCSETIFSIFHNMIIILLIFITIKES